MAYSNSRAIPKWWFERANDEQKKLFELAKEDVICYLTINKEGVSARQLYKKMKDEECEINFKKIGFNRFAEFLFHIDDVLSVKTGAQTNDLYLFLKSFAGYHEDISHITELVRGTPASNKSYKGFKAKQSNTRFVRSEELLTMNCDPRPDGPPPSASASFLTRSKTLPRSRSSSSLRGGRRSGSSGRTFGARERQARLMSSRSHSVGHTVPTLKPVNAAAHNLFQAKVPSTVAPNVPALKPLNSAAQNLQSQLKPIVKPSVPVNPNSYQLRSRTVTNSNYNSAAITFKPPTLRTIQPNQNISPDLFAASISSSTWKPTPVIKPNPPSSSGKVPVLKPLSEIRKNNPGIVPKLMSGNNSSINNSQDVDKIRRNPVPQLKPISQVLRNTPAVTTNNNTGATSTTSNSTNPFYTQGSQAASKASANSSNVDHMMTNDSEPSTNPDDEGDSNDEEVGSDRDCDYTDEDDDGEEEFGWDENQENMDVGDAGNKSYLPPINETEDDFDGHSPVAPKICPNSFGSTAACSSSKQDLPPSITSTTTCTTSSTITSPPAPPPRLIGSQGSPRPRFQQGLKTISINNLTFGNPAVIKIEPTDCKPQVNALGNSNYSNIKVEVKTEESKIERFKKEVFAPEGLQTSPASRATSSFSYESYLLEKIKREVETSPPPPQSTSNLPSSSSSSSHSTFALKKKVYKTLQQSQMNLGMTNSFEATLVGVDEFGYMFVHSANTVIKDSFTTFHKDIRDYYNDPQHQIEHRMQPEEMEEGMYVIALVKRKSSEEFIRARISIICSVQQFCFVWDVDNCGYVMARFQDIFHIHGKFTMRHPQAVTLCLRGTEHYLLTKKFENLISEAFKKVNVNVQVFDINRPHPLLKVPVVRMRISDQKGEDLFDVLRTHSSALQNHFIPLTSLTSEQEQVLSKLQRIGHLVPVS